MRFDYRAMPGWPSLAWLAAVDERVGIPHADDHAADARPEQGPGAGGCASHVGAGLERHDERRAARVVARLLEGANFGMRLAGARVKAFGYGAPAPKHHGAHARVRMRRPHAPPRDPVGAAHGRGLRGVAAIPGRAPNRPLSYGIGL